MQVFDGKQFVPPRGSSPSPPPQATYDAEPSGTSRSITSRRSPWPCTTIADAKDFPPAYTADKDGKPLLSWRVLILPYLGAGELYKQFHLDEPWDSEHNENSLPGCRELPEPQQQGSGEGKTNYLTVRGEKTVFPGKTAIASPTFADGTSNTIMTVEVSDDKAVIWTKPDDFEYDEQDPMEGLVGLWPDGFIAGLADGSVRFVGRTIDPSALKAFFTRNGGEKVGERQALGK